VCPRVGVRVSASSGRGEFGPSALAPGTAPARLAHTEGRNQKSISRSRARPARKIGPRGVILAHFSCGRRERCTFPTSPWPAAASTTSPAPPTAQIHHLYRAPVPSPQTERRASVPLVNEGPRKGPGGRRPAPPTACQSVRTSPRGAAPGRRPGARRRPGAGAAARVSAVPGAQRGPPQSAHRAGTATG
jgi:hypothetical protein